jgi:hypothetical protein
MGKIGVYSDKTRTLQRKLSYEVYGLSFKEANFYLYLGDKDSVTPDKDTFENKVFYEVPDRLYSPTPIPVPVGMEPYSDSKMDFSRFGLINPMTDEVRFSIHIDDFVTLGRELVIGDVFEMPFFSKDNKKAFYEVTDVDFKSEKEKFICVFHANTLEASRATRDIPFNRDNFNIMDDVMSEADTDYAEIIPSDDTSFDFEQEPTPSEVDYRDELQSSFLDDPSKEF